MSLRADQLLDPPFSPIAVVALFGTGSDVSEADRMLGPPSSPRLRSLPFRNRIRCCRGLCRRRDLGFHDGPGVCCFLYRPGLVSVAWQLLVSPLSQPF